MLPFLLPGSRSLYPVVKLAGTMNALVQGAGGGVVWPVGTPTIAAVLPVTNPPHFDIGFDIAGGDATQVGDVARTRIDGVYDAAYNVTFNGNPAEDVTGTTLTAGAHTADVAIFRAGVQVSAYSSVANFTVPASATAPGAFTVGMWSVADLATTGDARVTLSSLPSDGGSAITRIDYRLNGGSWVDCGRTTTGTFDIAGLTDGVSTTVELRAVNAVGSGTDSDDKTVTTTAPAVSWATLYARSENQGHYDPSDITKLFKLPNFTDPVTADADKIGSTTDSSGKGNHLTQTTSGSRTEYDVTSGREMIYADSGKYLTSPSDVDLSGSPILSIIMALRDDDLGTGTYLHISDGTDSVSNPAIEILRFFGSPNPTLEARIYGDAGTARVGAVNTASTGASDRFVLRVRLDTSNPAATEIQMWLNGVSFGSVIASVENTNANYGAARRLALLNRGGGGLPVNFTGCYMAYWMNGDWSAGEIAFLEADAAARIA